MTAPDRRIPHPARLGRGTKLLTLATVGGLFGTGVLAWGLRQWGQRPSEFGVEPHPFFSSTLTLHGIAAYVFLVVLGALIPLHLRKGWHARQKRRSGGVLVGLLTLEIFSGLFLYYGGEGPSRSIGLRLHETVGGALVVFLAFHVLSPLTALLPVERPNTGCEGGRRGL